MSGTPGKVTTTSSLALARGIDTEQFASSRLLEIKLLLKKVATTSGAKRAHQTLPRHMRRRAASHNVKRLPIRLRQQAQKEIDQSGGAKQKKASRRQRRRPSNLNKEYERRSKANTWLETHMWHTKRFHMANLWGYRLPMKSCEKAARVNYRWLKTHCLLSDISYWQCIELTGTADAMFVALAARIHGLVREQFMTSLECTALACDAQGFPLAPVKVLLEPWTSQEQRDSAGTDAAFTHEHEEAGDGVDDDVDDVNNITKAKRAKSMSTVPAVTTSIDALSSVRHVWVWVHPSASSLVLKSVQSVCKPAGLTVFASSETPNTAVGSPSSSLCRFRLVGQVAHALLSATLQLAGRPSTLNAVVTPSSSSSANVASPAISDVPLATTAASVDSTKGGAVGGGHIAWTSLHGMQSPSSCSKGAALALDVYDPRLKSPSSIKPSTYKPTKAEVTSSAFTRAQRIHEIIRGWTPSYATSQLWTPVIRHSSLSTKRHQKEIDQRRSDQTVPGGDLQPAPFDSVVPVILTNNSQTPHNDVSKGFGAGWDIIFPAGWAREFWVNLTYAGARSIGVEETRTLAFEQGRLSFPQDFVGTVAYDEWWRGVYAAKITKFRRYPPAKRLPLHALTIAYPLGPMWRQLIDGTSGVFLKPVEATAMDVIEKGQQAKGHGQETEATKAGSGEGVSHADKTENAGESVSAATQAVPQVPSKTGRKRSKTKLAHRVEFAAVQSSVELNAIYDAVQLKSIGECLMHSNRSRIPKGHLVPVTVRAIGKGKLSEETMLCIPQVSTDVTEPLQLPHKVEDKTFRKAGGFLTKGGFSFARACEFGIGWITTDALTLLPTIAKDGLQALSHKSKVAQSKLAKDVVLLFPSESGDGTRGCERSGVCGCHVLVLAKCPSTPFYTPAVLEVVTDPVSC
eukprot:m.192051 g.192051  ORF g.192051 m.192051 type:complete len:911 (-) comp14850_c1_seq15:273-3005(-)